MDYEEHVELARVVGQPERGRHTVSPAQVLSLVRVALSNVVRYELLDDGRTLRAVEDVGGAAPPHHNVWMFARR